MVYGGQPVKTHWRNFQPRIGLAYALNPKTVLRAGFVMAYSTGALGIGGNGGTGPGQQGYNPPTLISSVVTGQPAFFWNGGVPAPVTPSPLLTAGFGAGIARTPARRLPSAFHRLRHVQLQRRDPLVEGAPAR